MGVNVAHYVMAGIKVTCEDVTWEEAESLEINYWEQPKPNSFGVLYDGMSGEYVIAGRVLAATSDDHDWFSEASVDLTLTPGDILDIQDEIETKLGIAGAEIKLYAVTHHS